jgi:hypothetical protein
LKARVVEHASLSSRGIHFPDLSLLDDWMARKSAFDSSPPFEYPTNSLIDESKDPIFTNEFNSESGATGKALRSLAVTFLQMAGPKLMGPFRDYVGHVHSRKEIYNLPAYDNVDVPHDPTMHILLGAQVTVKEVKHMKVTKMKKLSGKVGTAAEMRQELHGMEEGALSPA